MFAFYGSFLQVCEKMSNFLKVYISGMAGTIYFRSGMCSLPIYWHLHSEFGLVWSRDHGAMSARKIIFFFFVLIYSCCNCARMLHFLGPHDTLPCVLILLVIVIPQYEYDNVVIMYISTRQSRVQVLISMISYNVCL